MSKQSTQPPPTLAIRHRHKTETTSPSTPNYQPTNLRLWHNGWYFWRSHLQMHTHLQNWSTHCYSRWFCTCTSPNPLHRRICPPKHHCWHGTQPIPPFWPSLLSLQPLLWPISSTTTPRIPRMHLPHRWHQYHHQFITSKTSYQS